METYVVFRRNGWRSAENLEQAVRQSATVGDRMAEVVRWIRTYVVTETDGSLGMVCVYQASGPEAIRRHASAAAIPIDEIVAVADTVVGKDPRPVARVHRRAGDTFCRPPFWLRSLLPSRCRPRPRTTNRRGRRRPRAAGSSTVVGPPSRQGR
jgi:hypothetical protein